MIDYYIDAIITFTIIIFFVWIFILFILFVYNSCHFLGIIDTEKEATINPDDNIISKFIFGCRFLVYPIYLYLCWITVILAYIYWTWLLIIYFVPHLIFVGFIPIPFKIPILEFVPPFKQLTKRGVLPLLKRINIRLFEFLISGDMNIHKKNINDVYNFIYDEIKKMFIDFFKILKINHETYLQHIKPPIKPVIDPIIDNIEYDPDKEKAEEINRTFEEDDDKINIKKLINEEIAICIANKSKLMSSDLSSSELLVLSQTNVSNYADCYAKSLNLYINNQI
jgi:hypothetical protein